NRISFDGWLLRQAQSQGVKVENHRVSKLHLCQETKIEVDGRQLDYDLVVLSTGVNEGTLPIVGLNYTLPKTATMAQDELYVGSEGVKSKLGETAHAFLIPHSDLIFGTLVPKGPFINVSVLSSGKRPISVTEFLSNDMVRRMLPDRYERACGCYPRVIISPARNYYADGFVAIGDAAVSRLYKDGIGSALLTARQAAHTVIEHGLSRYDFERYYQPFCDNMSLDNQWGKRLFWINNQIKNSRVFFLSQHRLVGDEQQNAKGTQPFSKTIWGMFSGSYSYKDMARITFLNPLALLKLFTALSWEGLIRLFHRGTTTPRKLHVGGRKVLILGSGFGGTYVLRSLVPALNRNENVETTMVSNENFFLFSPLLHEVATGRVETRHAAYPIRRLHWRDRFNFIQANVEKIDLANRRVITTMGTLDFDYLIMALGSVTDMPKFEYDKDGAKNLFTLKTLRDSMLIRNHIVGVFEQASAEKSPERQRQLLTFVIAGAGYTGVQLVTEISNFIYRHLVRFYKAIDPNIIRILLIEAEPKIIAGLHTKLGAYTMKRLQEMKIETRLKSQITHIREGTVGINNKETVATSTLIWVAGVVANPRIAELDVAKDNNGRVEVNQYLEIPGIPGVYAVGDCAHFEDPQSGQAVPPRAHNAVRQAKIVARNILADIRGREKRAYRYSTHSDIVSLGASKAVFRFYGLRLYGLPARLVWLGAYSLLVTGVYNRIRIMTDWLLSFTFGRDTTFLKL
ncbi:MAG: FAD-dependent oxidoreductase, partial [Chloroflexi bacterium]|nr:FAD-dependent oxidoreductase [Chloroflexota bacterium]